MNDQICSYYVKNYKNNKYEIINQAIKSVNSKFRLKLKLSLLIIALFINDFHMYKHIHKHVCVSCVLTLLKKKNTIKNKATFHFILIKLNQALLAFLKLFIVARKRNFFAF